MGTVEDKLNEGDRKDTNGKLHVLQQQSSEKRRHDDSNRGKKRFTEKLGNPETKAQKVDLSVDC